MRYTSVAIAVSMIVAVSSSAILSAPAPSLDPRAENLLAEGRLAQEAGNLNGAIDAYEAALAVMPGNVTVLLAMADATRRQGLQGKALHYYRVALTTDPRNIDAIAGEGVALAEKGATEKANQNLARLQSLCGRDCTETQQLAGAIAKASAPRMVSAEPVAPKTGATEN